MPIFEYICRDCKKRFEALVYGSRKPECPLCHSLNLDHQVSVFSVRAAKPGRVNAAAAGCGSGACGTGACPFE